MPDLASPSLPPAVPSGKEGGHLSLSGDTLLSPRTLVLSLGASATRNSQQCTGCPCIKLSGPFKCQQCRGRETMLWPKPAAGGKGASRRGHPDVGQGRGPGQHTEAG